MLICPAVHIPTRSLLRSSSTPEPSDPLYSIVFTITVDQKWPSFQQTVYLTAPHGGESKLKPKARGEKRTLSLEHLEMGRNSIKLRFSRIKETKKRQANGRQAISPRQKPEDFQ